MKNTYEERAKKFIRQLDSYINISGLTQDDCEVAALFFNLDRKRNVVVKHGLTRVAFITSDYVVKIDCPQNPEYIYRFGGCETEEEVYQQAKMDGFDYMFAKITCYPYNGLDYYIMPRINNVSKTDYDADDYLTDEERTWLYKNGIRDLHYKNYGWYKNRPIIFDYACRR